MGYPLRIPQRPAEKSTVSWGRAGVIKTAFPAKVTYLIKEDGGRRGPSKMEGTMTFCNVPTDNRAVVFSFGHTGYSLLAMTLGQEEP